MRDADVRQSIWAHLEQEHDGDPDTLMLDELAIVGGASRVDVAVINGEITGYELKSSKDTLERLPSQRDLYNLVFDRVHLVVAENHLNGARALVPQWWGILVASSSKGDKVEISRIRDSEQNLGIDSATLCSFLWRDEALSLLDSRGALRGYKSKPKNQVYARVCELFPQEELKTEVRAALKSRECWRSDRRAPKDDGLLQ